MNEKLESLLQQMQVLEKDILRELQKKEMEFFYEVRQGKVRFTKEARAQHRRLIKRFTRYIRDSRFMILLTTPVIWSCIIPIVLLDVFMVVYQAICFPIYGIPKVKRSDYIKLDRRHLAYLNWAEKFNCEYCGYANGVLACASEVAARTEQYWCPIKHALRMKSMHSRYRFFFDYGDAEHYRRQIEKVRRSFEDIEKAEAAEAPAQTGT
ncbi:hypothetical protein [Prosthecobacter vanneervenii]|uniref:Uncharacterized protein n=1 Tax=Prosthecobacter vanneervenii TaxID=48466 RepID=A0A7W7Y887_9BACT|nr:hypothetical protein [Prosthecobacter vanneervenii]MBB5031394.1 hypothetical protein [Prosthecobacter vanneervenii]